MIKGYYFITDHDLSKAGNISDVKNAVDAGVNIVQYRKKTGSTRELCKEATELKKICKNNGNSNGGDSLFIVNDRIDVALAVDADGVHLGQRDMSYDAARKILGKNKIIGLTAHNLDEAINAEKLGADYLGASPIFSTTTKADAGKPAGVSLIKKIKQKISIPVVAIGGINLENATDVVDAGADALCAISAVVTKDDVKEEIKKFQNLFKQNEKSNPN